ncbi:MAG TPA: adenosylcobinamide-GDP ribazoletransferase [Streptosporangiaceae bacterium]
MRRAMSFLTPLGGAATPAPSALPWFPVAGALIGLGVGGAWWGASRVWAAPAAAAIAVITDAALTGMLHLDGFADAADGLLPPLPRSRRLAVMADPQIGAFGAAALVIALLTRFGAFAAMAPSPLAVSALWAGSRTLMAVVVGTVPYARPGGLAQAFLPSPATAAAPAPIGPASATPAPATPAPAASAPVASAPAATAPAGPVLPRSPRLRPVLLGLAGALLAVGLAVAGRGVQGLAAVAAGAVAGAAVVFLGWRRLGGFTGDVLGAAAVAGETVGLLTLAWQW